MAVLRLPPPVPDTTDRKRPVFPPVPADPNACHPSVLDPGVTCGFGTTTCINNNSSGAL